LAIEPVRRPPGFSTWGACALFCIFSLRIVVFRRSKRISLGHDNNDELKRAIRVHGNFAEYCPIFLILLMIMEIHLIPQLWLLGISLSFIVGRVSHAYGIINGPSILPFRTIGMAITMTCLLSAVLALILLGQF